MITKTILKEVDARKIPRYWIGTYAFVLAYNQGLKEGLFPRHQPIEIEFVFGSKSIWANGVMTINIVDRPYEDFFKTGPGHDLLHGLTQNSQPHFGTFPKNDLSVSTGNKTDYRYRNVKRAFDVIKQKHGVDLAAVFPKNSYKGNIEDFIEKDVKGYIATMVKQARKGDIFSREFKKWDNIEYDFDKITRPSNYFSNNHIQKGGKNNPTHAIEEEIGNVVSDQFARFLANSEPIEKRTVSYILNLVNDWDEAKEFGYYNHPSNDDTILRWKEHMGNVLPRFIELYNQKLAMLAKTSIGSIPIHS